MSNNHQAGVLSQRLEVAGARVGSDTAGIVAETFGEHCYEYARLFAYSPKMFAMLTEFVSAWQREIDNDEEINGADAVDFIVGFHADVSSLLAQVTDGKG